MSIINPTINTAFTQPLAGFAPLSSAGSTTTSLPITITNAFAPFPNAVPPINPSDALTKFKWLSTVNSKTNTQATLLFSTDKSLSIFPGGPTNTLNTSYQSNTPNTFTTGPILATMMMPPPEFAEQERFLFDVFNSKEIPFTVTSSPWDNSKSILALIHNPTPSSTTAPTTPQQPVHLEFLGTMTNEAKYGTPDIVFFDVSPQLIQDTATGVTFVEMRQVPMASTTVEKYPLSSLEGYQHNSDILSTVRFKRYTTKIPSQPYVYEYDFTIPPSTDQ